MVQDGTIVNAVTLGPLRIALTATRKNVKDGTTTIAVTFRKTNGCESVWQNTVVEKEIQGGGIWKYRYNGVVKDVDGSKKRVRILEAPSLFVLEQPAE
jgi:hypothetical protein